jgi:hypothetical protein
VLSIGQKESYQGMIKCQAIIWFMVWLIDEALNVLKMWPPEQLSGDKMMKKMTNIR